MPLCAKFLSSSQLHNIASQPHHRRCSVNFGVVVFDQVEELDFIGPWEMLTMWSKFAQGPPNCLIVSQSPGPVSCAKGLSINPHVTFAACPPLDYLLVPGGQGTRRESENPVLLEFVARQSVGCKAILSVCTGAFILHAAGLLTGKKATTHWGSLTRLRELGDVFVVEERYVQDGNVWSCAGVSAGTDLMLAFIASVAGEESAGKVQFAAEYYPSSVKYGGFENRAEAPAYLRA
jgi:transcriptional regulator GlxA family with amidase domain